MGETWQRIDSRQIADHGFFKLRQDRSVHPRHGREYDFFVFEWPDWVNVIPVTPAGEILFIRQFRHGSREVTLEIPGGTVDEGETPREAALRELFEETGYRARESRELGWVHPNPAIQANRCWTFLATGVKPVREPVGDGSEAIDIALVPMQHVPGLFQDGTITHALVVAAFHHYARRLGEGRPGTGG